MSDSSLLVYLYYSANLYWKSQARSFFGTTEEESVAQREKPCSCAKCWNDSPAPYLGFGIQPGKTCHNLYLWAVNIISSSDKG